MEFFKHHVLLIGLALGSGLALILPVLSRSASGVMALSVTEAVVLMNRKSALILDVRETDEFAQGHLLGARHMPLAQLGSRISEIQKFKEKPVLLVCQRGNRANTAAKVLKAQGFTTLHVLNGGMAAWVEAKMPATKSTA